MKKMTLKTSRLLRLAQLRYLLCTMGLLLNATACGAMSSMYDAQVLDKNGVPCFTVQKNHQKDAPELASIGVYDESPGGHEMWRQFSIELDRVPLFFSPSFCLLYGTLLENTGKFSKPTPLEVGKPYVVNISADLPKGSGSENRRYKGRFCLSRTESGGIKVHQVIYDKGWRYEVCQP